MRPLKYKPGEFVGYFLVVGHTPPMGRKKYRWLLLRCTRCGAEIQRTMRKFSGHPVCACSRAKDTFRKLHLAEYNAWTGMHERCDRPESPGFKNYGGRGIKICPEWQDSFEAFYRDLGSKPTPQHSIDRIDNDKGYSKENCRWATRSEQQRNTRTNRLLTINGQTKCLEDWSSFYGIKPSSALGRIERGWPLEKAFSTPVSTKNKTRLYKIGVEEKTLLQWAQFAGVKKDLIRYRLQTGWTLEEAVGLKVKG